eukprot:1955694-Prymnesium_polylepis.1
MLNWETIAHHVHHKLNSFPHWEQDHFFTGGVQVGDAQYEWPNAPSEDPAATAAYGRSVPDPDHSRTDTARPNFWIPCCNEGRDSRDSNDQRVIQLEYRMGGFLYGWQDLKKIHGRRSGCLCAR